jgi:hypothetical protein
VPKARRDVSLRHKRTLQDPLVGCEGPVATIWRRSKIAGGLRLRYVHRSKEVYGEGRPTAVGGECEAFCRERIALGRVSLPLSGGDMPVFLFWNVGKKSPLELISAACHEHKVDILLLAESGACSSAVLSALNNVEFRFNEFSQVPSSVTLFHRLPSNAVQAVSDDGRVSVRRVKPPLGREILIIACHLRSKLYSDPADQYLTARSLRKKIIEAENSAGHQNSILIGDFNMNPFEQGMNAADGLHAVMDKQIAARKSRVFQGEQSDFFYNPMWSRLGDESNGPSGTYFEEPHTLPTIIGTLLIKSS